MKKKLPKKFRGADVVRGLGLKQEPFDKLCYEKAIDEFDATCDSYLVVPDGALHPDESCEVHAFRDEKDAMRFARAMACGNVDHRVLRVTEQTLVVATENDL